MIIGVPKELHPEERRVALIPATVAALAKAGHEVIVQSGAGGAAGHGDRAYTEAGARIESDRTKVFEAEVILMVQGPGSNTKNGDEDLARFRKGQVIVGFLDPLSEPGKAKQLADTGATAVSMELVPRITRAQSMDALSSMATVAGYKAVLLAADTAPRMFPLLMTAAGTVAAAKVFVIGAGVAGLQAIATARRLGAIVEAYDVRPAAREQILSVGAKPVELKLEAEDTEDKGGYAKEQSEEFLRRQREMMKEVVTRSDVVITTAAIPGKKAPVLVTKDMVGAMQPGSVIVDLAAERGGNCELSRAGETVIEHGVTIMGPANLPASIPVHASQMYAKNLQNLLKELTDKEGNLKVDIEDDVIGGCTVTHGGEVVHPRIRELLGMGGEKKENA